MPDRHGDFIQDTRPTTRIEAGWVNDPKDRGGETIFGISRVFNPSWEGWALVDQMRGDPSFPKNVNADAGLREMAATFFRKGWWEPIHGDELPWRISECLYDMAVNSCAYGNPKVAVRQLQASLNFCGAGLEVDGELGPRTVKACWDAGKTGVKEFLNARCGFYVDIILKDQSQRRFAHSWFGRVIEMADYTLEG